MDTFSFSLPTQDHTIQHSGNITHLKMSAALRCDLGFEPATCAPCLPSNVFGEFNSSYLTDGATLTPLNTNTLYFFHSSTLSFDCRNGSIVQIGVAVDETTSTGMHTIQLLYYFRSPNPVAQFTYYETHNIRINITGPGINTLNVTLPNPFTFPYYGIRSSTLRFLSYPVATSALVRSVSGNLGTTLLVSQLQTVSGRLLLFVKYQPNRA